MRGTGPLEDMPLLLSADDFESSLDAVRAAAAGPIEGIFGPESLTWRVDREAAIFLGAGRALLLQLAHPWVAAAISEHSRTFADPVGRFHRTFNITFTMVFGTLDQALAASRRLHRRHAVVTGILPQGGRPLRGRLALQRQRGLGAALGSRHAGGDRLADA